MKRFVDDFLVYGLRDPRNNEIRYIGKSARGLSRPESHSRNARNTKRAKTYRDNWILQMESEGFRYEIIVLERLSSLDDLNDAECRWIKIGREALGNRLTNLTDGGEGVPGLKPSSMSLQRMSIAQQKLAASPAGRAHLEVMWTKRDEPQSRKKLSDSSRKRAATAEGRLHLDNIRILTNNPDSRKKQSETCKENAKKPERRAQFMVGLLKGHEKAKTPEGREKNAERGRKRFATSEGQAQILAALALAHSPEARAKVAAASRHRAATPEGKAQIISSLTKAQEATKAKLSAMTPEQLSARGRAGLASLPPDKRSDIARRREAAKRQRRLNEK